MTVVNEKPAHCDILRIWCDLNYIKIAWEKIHRE